MPFSLYLQGEYQLDKNDYFRFFCLVLLVSSKNLSRSERLIRQTPNLDALRRPDSMGGPTGN